MFAESQVKAFYEQGYLLLGRVLDQDSLAALQQRIDAIMLGQIRYPGMYFQLDSETGNYGDVGSGGEWAVSSLNYRKIQDLEKDDLFLDYMQHPLYRAITRRLVGENVSIFRAMFMNKPAGKGTYLPYHQDAGSQWQLDRDPDITVWTALDEATEANGCVQVIPGSHKLGLLSERGHTITPEQEAEHAPEAKSRFLEVEAGEAILLHNLLLHRSGINKTNNSRRAFSVCYMDASIRRIGHPDDSFPVIFGENALVPGWCQPAVSV